MVSVVARESRIWDTCHVIHSLELVGTLTDVDFLEDMLLLAHCWPNHVKKMHG